MDLVKLQLMGDSSEVIHYEHADIPLLVLLRDLSSYPGMSAPCHWHQDLEWIYIRQGTMYYSVNGRQVLLEEGDTLLVNARQMHYGYSHDRQECRFVCLLFHPSLFWGCPALVRTYVTPVLKNCGLEYVHLPAAQEEGREAEACFSRIIRLKELAPEGYEMEAASQIQLLWSRLWQRKKLFPGPTDRETEEDLNIQKDMVAFLYQHYGEKITLDAIAASGNVSRSKCCRIFRRYLNQSPMDFLNAYRLKVSCNLLVHTDKSITEIALACGFPHLSYFSRLFCGQYGCRPREYRSRAAAVSSPRTPLPAG